MARSARFASGIIALAGVLAGCTTAPAEPKTFASWQEMCSACHGPDGNSLSVRAPILAGQQQAYLSDQLKAFRAHARADADGRAFMWPMAAGLDDPMIERLSAYFASLPTPAADASPEGAASEGKTLYASGPCSSCHGANGEGVAPFPRLAGQHADYLSAQLMAYADDSRPHPVMGPMAKTLNQKQMQSVAAYLATQR